MSDQVPEGAKEIDKEMILLAFDSATSSLIAMRTLLDMLIPDGVTWIITEDDGSCPHANRAPSDASFCLDCEQTVGGVSEGFTGGESA